MEERFVSFAKDIIEHLEKGGVLDVASKADLRSCVRSTVESEIEDPHHDEESLLTKLEVLVDEAEESPLLFYYERRPLELEAFRRAGDY